MTTQAKILAFIEANPGCTNADIAKGVPEALPKHIAARTGVACKAGTLRREKVDGLFRYYLVGAQEAVNAKARAFLDTVAVAPPLIVVPPTPITEDALRMDMPGFENVRIHKGNAMSTPPKKDKSAPIVQSIDKLVEQLAQRIAERVRDRVVQEIEAMIPPPAKKEDVQAVVATTRLRVGVVGCYTNWIDIIRRDFKNELEIISAEHDAPIGKVKSLGVTCPVTFVMKDHVSHKVTDSLTSIGANVRYVSGGTTQLRDALTDYYVKEVA